MTTSYYTYPNADRKIFCWAIIHSDIQDCLIKIQWPFERQNWKKKKIRWRGLLQINIPTYLIQEYGQKIHGDPYWDIPF